VNSSGGLRTAVLDGAEISIFHSVSGG
jgi:molybdopterin converting factor small subunit